MNRYTRHTYGTTDAENSFTKNIDLAAFSTPHNGAIHHFGDQLAFARPPRRENDYTTESGQKVDIAQPSASAKVAPDDESAAQPDGRSKANKRGPTEETDPQAGKAGGRRGARKGSGRRQRDKSPNPKHQRAAEARLRYELLEEERELLDNLADFWDERFDKPRRQRAPLPPWDAHKSYAPPAASDGEEDELPCAPGHRSGRR